MTCSAGTSNTTDDDFDKGSNLRNGRVYINAMEAAMCNGSVHGWNYCFRPSSRQSSTRELKVAMYRLQPNGTYRQVEGSYYELRVEFDAFNTTCGNISLQPSQRFSVQQGDVVGFCEERNTVQYQEKTDSLLLYWDAGGCSEILSNDTILSEWKDRTLFLSALIGKAIKNTLVLRNVRISTEKGETMEDESGSSGLGGGAVAGITIVVLTVPSALAIGAVVGIFLYYKRKQDKQKQGNSNGS